MYDTTRHRHEQNYSIFHTMYMETRKITPPSPETKSGDDFLQQRKHVKTHPRDAFRRRFSPNQRGLRHPLSRNPEMVFSKTKGSTHPAGRNPRTISSKPKEVKTPPTQDAFRKRFSPNQRGIRHPPGQNPEMTLSKTNGGTHSVVR